jgi:hypothetical protein
MDEDLSRFSNFSAWAKKGTICMGALATHCEI